MTFFDVHYEPVPRWWVHNVMFVSLYVFVFDIISWDLFSIVIVCCPYFLLVLQDNHVTQRVKVK